MRRAAGASLEEGRLLQPIAAGILQAQADATDIGVRVDALQALAEAGDKTAPGRLSAMGLLGFDLDENHFFYRRLPYKLSRILSLNPRMKDAEKLLAERLRPKGIIRG